MSTQDLLAGAVRPLGAVPHGGGTTEGPKLVSVVLPLHNEAGNIEELYERLCKVFDSTQYRSELLFVDDGSKDESGAMIEALAARDPRVKYIKLSRNFGHQNALTAGLDFAEGDAVICMDSDLQHPPELIRSLLKLWEEGYAVVYTLRRSTKQLSMFKKVTAAGFYKLMQWMSPLPIEPNTSDFRLVDRRVCYALRHNRERERFYRGMIPWVGFKQIGIEFNADARRAGVPSYTLVRMLQFSLNGLLSYSYMPLYALLLFALGFLAVGTLYGGVVLYLRFVTHKMAPDHASIILLVILMGAAQLAATCVSSIYAYKAYQESKGRPLYVVDRTVGLGS